MSNEYMDKEAHFLSFAFFFESQGLKGSFSAQALEKAALLYTRLIKCCQAGFQELFFLSHKAATLQRMALFSHSCHLLTLFLKIISVDKNTCLSTGSWGQALVGTSRSSVPWAIISHELAKTAGWCPPHSATI